MDILAIGDIVVDAFIRLKDAHVNCRLNNEDCEICMKWGDKIPYDSLEVVPGVGNAANAAVAAARLGLKSALRAYVGDDAYGADCTKVLKRDHMDTAYVERAHGKRTNYHFVLSFESERTILVKHEQFDYTVPTLTEIPKWLYLSSLGENSLAYHAAWVEWLTKNPSVKLAFQPGTFQIKIGKDALADVYKRSDIFFCNKEEARKILGIESEDIKNLLKQIQALGPKVVVITNDRKGAYAMAENGDAYFIPMYPDQRPPVNRTGAGDAFASSVVSALALGLPLTEALLWGPINAMEVVQYVGAQKGLLAHEQLKTFLQNAPTEYKLSAL